MSMGGVGEAARIFITVGLNSETARAGLTSLSKEVDAFGSKVSAWGKAVGSAFKGPLDAFGQIGDAADGMKSVANGIKGVTQALFSGAARNEQYAVSFEVLLGSADAAQEKLKELKAFANTTPFTLPGIVESSKQLEVMGGALLNTDKNLRMVGDVASGTGTDIQAVAVQFGRLYDGLKNGSPLGEVTMRLGEIGAVSGEGKRKILALAEAVKSGSMSMDEAWAASSQEFKRWGGQTAKQAETISGLWSTFTDTIDDGLAQIGTKMLPTIKPVLKKVIDLFGKLGDAGIYVMDNFQVFAPFVMAFVIPAVLSLAAAVWGLAAGVIAATWPFLAIGAVFAGVIAIIQQMNPGVDVLGNLMKMLGEAVVNVVNILGTLLDVGRNVVGVISFIQTPLARLVDVLGMVAGAVIPAATAVETIGTSAEQTAKDAEYAVEAMRGRLGDELAQAAVDMAAKAPAAFRPIETEASKAARAAVWSVKTMNSDILASFEATRNEVTGAATALSESLTRPFEVAAQIVETKAALTEAAEAASNKKLSAAARSAAAATLRDKQAALFKLLSEETTFGTTQERIAKINALMTNNAYVTTLKNGTVEQRAAYANWVSTMEDELADLEGVARKEGMDAGKAVGPGFKSAAPTATAMEAWGELAMDAYRKGMVGAVDLLKNQLRAKFGIIRGMLEANSPPGPESPLHKIDVWGEKTGLAWAEGLTSAISSAGNALHSALGPSSAALSPSTGAMQGAAAAGGGGMGGGVTIQLSFSSTVPYSPAEQLELGNRVGPAAADWLTSHGYIS